VVAVWVDNSIVSAIATPNDSNCLFNFAYKGDSVVMHFERKGDQMIATIVACETNELEKIVGNIGITKVKH